MNFNSMSDVVDSHPKDTLNRIRNICDGTDLSEGIDWAVLGQYSATQAYNCHLEGNNAGVFDWSELGVEVYRRLKTKEQPSEHELAEMRLRANAIVFCGLDRSNSLLNPEVIESWFFKLVPYSLEKARRRISKVNSVQSEDFDELRSLKERLSTIKGLVEKAVFQKNAELLNWMSLRELLP